MRLSGSTFQARGIARWRMEVFFIGKAHTRMYPACPGRLLCLPAEAVDRHWTA